MVEPIESINKINSLKSSHHTESLPRQLRQGASVHCLGVKLLKKQDDSTVSGVLHRRDAATPQSLLEGRNKGEWTASRRGTRLPVDAHVRYMSGMLTRTASPMGIISRDISFGEGGGMRSRPRDRLLQTTRQRKYSIFSFYGEEEFWRAYATFRSRLESWSDSSYLAEIGRIVFQCR